MASSVSPSEATPLIQNTSTADGVTPNGTSKRSSNFLRMSLSRSMSTLEEAVSSMKRIGYLGSMSIAVNSLTGPAM